MDGSVAGQLQADWNQTDNSQVDYIKNKPTIPSEVTETTVANWGFTKNTGTSTFSGSYNDLTDKPTIPAAQVQPDWNASSGMGQILNKPTIFSGSYNDLTNKPVIPIIWNGTQAQYDALASYDSNTIYIITSAS